MTTTIFSFYFHRYNDNDLDRDMMTNDNDLSVYVMSLCNLYNAIYVLLVTAATYLKLTTHETTNRCLDFLFSLSPCLKSEAASEKILVLLDDGC